MKYFLIVAIMLSGFLGYKLLREPAIAEDADKITQYLSPNVKPVIKELAELRKANAAATKDYYKEIYEIADDRSAATELTENYKEQEIAYIDKYSKLLIDSSATMNDDEQEQLIRSAKLIGKAKYKKEDKKPKAPKLLQESTGWYNEW
jgi:DNA-binding transcriptional regulator GbsR (MarR family)